ncbi:CRISPR-associated CARF protein Csa3 [Natranaeroarchaeum sulfidigenes]|uniref:CRISPR-Cas associated transcriptional regulator,contains CARF and HTH domain n=1 Tax=Natranaeroarchaeum sulfidigenes TaxID=2784880 RepID=A0A897MU69_9EURY|nr:CRISPR-associated CARF protein Csa3 [Natranaeroarchaeum sulfidigenes]QSG04062.1 CRISPR-Cas associated transcriptional regulator,contains CARF and HTH domain [Natranaeroarchaeum sulfidigenes]
MQTYISPIGFNTTSVTRALINHGIDGGDSVVLIRPAEETDNNRGTEAVADVEQLLQEIASTITVSVTRIPHDEFDTAVMRCSETIRTAEGEVVVSLSGGARDVLLPLTVATMAHYETVESTLGYSDIDGQIREWHLPNITATPSDGQRKTLTAIKDAEGKVSIPELTTHRESAKSTITRHVNDLEDDGFVTSQTVNRTKHVSITLAGRLCLARTRSF